jgi:hypothetical protein
MFSGRRHPSDAQLLAAVDRELSLDVAAGVDAHLRECRACADRADAYRRALASLVAARDASPFHTTADLANARRALLAAVRPEAGSAASPAPLAVRHGRPLLWPLAGAALVVLGVVAGLLFFTGHHRRGSSLDRIADAGGPLPIASLTPGAVRDIPVPVLCAGDVAEERTIPPNMRAQVLRAYRMEHVPADQFELDYLITPQLGGATAAANLWPERYGAHAWNARVKDQLETLLPSLVCRGEVDLRSAQREIADNWITAYKKYFKTDRPVETVADVRERDTDALALDGARFRLISFTPIK